MSYKSKIDNLILNYFIQEGYKEAAIAFSKEKNIDLSKDTKHTSLLDSPSIELLNNLKSINGNDEFMKIVQQHEFDFNCNKPNKHKNARIIKGYSTINERREIKYLILKGEITTAIQKISEYFPTVLDSNNLLHFKLLRLSLIEMIRNHKLSNNQDKTNDLEKEFLSDILLFVRQNLINKVTRSFKLLRELEITMSLLCFNFDSSVNSIEEQKDLPEELRSLFDLSLRSQCYKLVNRSILDLNKDSNGDNMEDDLESIEQEQKYFDKLKYSTKSSYDINEINRDELNEYNQTLNSDNEWNDFDITKMIDSGEFISNNGDEQETINDELTDDDQSKLQELALESRLERVVKLWSVTEERLATLKYKDKNMP